MHSSRSCFLFCVTQGCLFSNRLWTNQVRILLRRKICCIVFVKVQVTWHAFIFLFILTLIYNVCYWQTKEKNVSRHRTQKRQKAISNSSLLIHSHISSCYLIIHHLTDLRIRRCRFSLHVWHTVEVLLPVTAAAWFVLFVNVWISTPWADVDFVVFFFFSKMTEFTLNFYFIWLMCSFFHVALCCGLLV